MPSSPAEPDPAALLAQLTSLWDQAYEAAAAGDLERAGRHLKAAAVLLAQPAPVAPATGGLASGLAEAQASQGRLQAALRAAQAATAAELERVRAGQKALRRYANLGAPQPGRVERQG